MCFNKMKAFILFSLLFYCFCNSAYAEAVETQLSRDKIALGETVTVSFNLNNLRMDATPDLTPLEQDFRIVNTSYRNAINILNGAARSEAILQITLEPRRIGELLIPEINFGNVKSKARKLLVENETPINGKNQQNNGVFVQATINTDSPYVQSQLLYTFKLFYRIPIDNPRIEPMHIENAVLAQVGDDKFYQTIIKNEQFFVVEKNFVIFPQKPGKLLVPATHLRALQLDANGNMMNDFFPIAANKPVNLATQSFVINVKKIPESFQGKVWLPAKNISLTESWSSQSNNWETGSPITRTITIEAQGLRADQIPDLTIDNIAGVNIYADTPHRSNRFQDNTLIGTWQQKISYIPNSPKSLTIPPVQLPWWNTQTNTNAIAQLKPINVQIIGKPNNAKLTPRNTIETPTTVNDLPIQNPVNMNVQTTQTAPFYLSMWFWISIGLFSIWLVTLVYIWRGKTSVKKKAPVSEQGDQWNSKSFAQACEQGDLNSAQKLLLLWAKNEWQDPPVSLGKLGEMIHDENFKIALAELEKALYAGEKVKWDGQALLSAHQQLRKQHRKNLSQYKNKIMDKQKQTLPPLHP